MNELGVQRDPVGPTEPAAQPKTVVHRRFQRLGVEPYSTLRERIDPAASPANFQRITLALEHWRPGQETSLARVFEQMIPLLKRRSLVFIISDFFDRLEPLKFNGWSDWDEHGRLKPGAPSYGPFMRHAD